MPDTIRTIIHAYNFDTSKAHEAAEYAALVAARTAEGREVFKTCGGGSHYLPHLDGAAVDLETTHVFDDQWNTAPIPGVSDKGLRVFDWAEDAIFGPRGRENLTIRRGHWLELTDDMQRARRETLTCGYCGAHYRPGGYPADLAFCTKCTGSEYLKESELRLTRLLPAGESFGGERAPLTEAEAAALLPVYREAQLTGRNARDAAATEQARKRIAKRRADTIAAALQKIADAETKRDIELWTLDNLGYAFLGNVIYYSHTGRACFGWYKPLEADALSLLLDKVSEFRWPYDIRCADGRTLSGEC